MLSTMAATDATYSREEISALKGIFSLYDTDDSGYISTTELTAVLAKIGRTGDDSEKIVEAAAEFGEKITFDDFLKVLEKGNKDVPGEGSDPKVMEVSNKMYSLGLSFCSVLIYVRARVCYSY